MLTKWYANSMVALKEEVRKILPKNFQTLKKSFLGKFSQSLKIEPVAPYWKSFICQANPSLLLERCPQVLSRWVI